MMPPEIRRAIIRWTLQSAAGVVGYAALLFWAAGRLDWLWGWAFIALLAAALLGHVIVLVPTNPALLAERQKGIRRTDAPRWDRWIAAFGAGLMPFISWAIAGLNVRFGWEAPMPIALHLIGLALGIAGWGMFLWALGANAFFSEAVRIQTERGHSVQSSGPYRFVRHPGYLGACLTFLGTPFLLGSRWALIPTLIGIALYVLRTALEDRYLHANLDGYTEYAQQTHYRLIPGLW